MRVLCWSMPPKLHRYSLILTAMPIVAFLPSTYFTTRNLIQRLWRLHSSTQTRTIMSFGGGKGVVVPARQTTGKQPATLIFLHGLGDTGNGWAPAFPFPGLEYMKVVLPTAGSIPVSLNMGMCMPAFFDLYGLGVNDAVDETGIQRAIARVNRIVEEEIAAGVDKKRIVVGGFSQGGALALRYGLQTEGLGGIVGLSSWLAGGEKAVRDAKAMNKVLMCHGDDDILVRCEYGKRSATLLKEHGHDVQFVTFAGMAHGACPEELDTFATFLKSIFET